MKSIICRTLALGAAAFMLGCAPVPYSSGTYERQKIDPGAYAEVRIAIDCSVGSLDLAETYLMGPPDSGFNESACKKLAARVMARFDEGEYANRFQNVSLEYVSLGQAYRSELERQRNSMGQYLSANPECDESGDVAFDDLTWCQKEVVNLREKLTYLDSPPLVLIDKSSELSKQAVFEIGDFNSTYPWSANNRKFRGVLGADFEAVNSIGMSPNQYLLHIQAAGVHLVSEEDIEKLLTRKAASSALLVTTCIVGACIALDPDYNPTYELSAVLVNSEGKAVYGSETHFTYEPENSQIDIISMLVEDLMPLDVFQDAGKASTKSEDEEGRDADSKSVNTPLLIEA
jgi:hypothetical protein